MGKHGKGQKPKADKRKHSRMIYIIGALVGINLGILFSLGVFDEKTPRVGAGKQPAPASLAQGEAAAQLQELATKVANSADRIWPDLLAGAGAGDYEKPRLAQFAAFQHTACGGASGAVGAFYCPDGRRIHLDQMFIQSAQSIAGKHAEITGAHIIAHQFAHHVQHLVGRPDLHSPQAEMQADCYVGIWAHHAGAEFSSVSEASLIAAFDAAAQYSSTPALQKRDADVRFDSFSAGAADARKEWLLRGFRTGDLAECDTGGEAL